MAILTAQIITNIIKNIAGRPPIFESIFIPVIPSLTDIIIQVTIPTTTTHIIIRNLGGSGDSGEIPLLQRLEMARVVESDAVTSEIRTAIR